MALYGGIDLHSRISWLVILDGALKMVLQVKLVNDLKEFLRLLEPFRADLAGLAVESTPNWYWLVDGLQEAGYRMHLTNTCAVQQYSGLRSARRAVAGALAGAGHSARGLHLSGTRTTPSRLAPAAWLPGGEEDLDAAVAAERFRVPHRSSGQLGHHQEVDGCGVALGLTCLLEPIKVMSTQIRMLEKEVLAQAKLRDEFAPLRTVWGIGPILALTVMLEVGDIKRFEKVGNFASYCRLVKTDRFSVGKRKGSGNAKNGNPYLSWAFSEAAHFATRYHDAAKRFYHRKMAKTNGILAIRALAHKLARASYYVMRDKVEFDQDRLFTS